MASLLQKEFDWYLAHQDELVQQHRGRFVVIKDEKVIGVYDDVATAVTATQREHEIGTFLVQKAEPGEAAYSQTFHSRVVA